MENLFRLLTSSCIWSEKFRSVIPDKMFSSLQLCRSNFIPSIFLKNIWQLWLLCKAVRHDPWRDDESVFVRRRGRSNIFSCKSIPCDTTTFSWLQVCVVSVMHGPHVTMHSHLSLMSPSSEYYTNHALSADGVNVNRKKKFATNIKSFCELKWKKGSCCGMCVSPNLSRSD